MTRLDDITLDKDPVVGKAGFRLIGGRRKAFLHLLGRMGDPHALAASARRGLDHDGKADLLGDLHRVLGRLDHADMARHNIHFGFLGEPLGFDLVAHRLDRLRARADKGDALRLEAFCETGVLGEEAVARMNRVGSGCLHGLDDPVDQQITLRRRRRPDMKRLIRHPDMQRVFIRVGINRHRPDTHAPRGPDDAAGNLSPIGDQDFREHVRPPPPGTERRPSTSSGRTEQGNPQSKEKGELYSPVRAEPVEARLPGPEQRPSTSSGRTEKRPLVIPST